jgi:hypothetical protein
VERACDRAAAVGVAPAVVSGVLLVPRVRVAAVDLATGATASSGDTDLLSASATAVVARHAERVMVLAPA